MKIFDIVFFTNQPAFYKINLYNEISKKKKVLVIFLGVIESDRTKDFITGNMNFEYLFINKTECEKRNKLKSCFRLIKVLRNIKYNLKINCSFFITFDRKIIKMLKISKKSFIMKIDNLCEYFTLLRGNQNGSYTRNYKKSKNHD